ncbi:MAG: hypothetical protein A3J75_02355 [Acidobacteria bacterium RBG_16_68_9]|nr:MAG: hypothetical protein A3J75_02355 [Acidobacteria bacterium RBG_16_68_9]
MQVKALVVEDNPDSAVILRAILENDGCSVDVVDNGMDALRQLETAMPDVVLLDLMMPVMSGIEVLEGIRGRPHTARLPVIVVTAKIRDDDVMGGYRCGADYYITKPFTARQLLYGLRLVLGEQATQARAGGKENEGLA